MKNIALTGFMGTGKTEVGRLVARKLGVPFMDADAAIEQSAGMKISEIFASRGEAAFRDIEAAVIRELAAAEGAVISTGGGAVLRQENMDSLRSKGIIVCLTASVRTILHRTRGSSDRPLLMVDDPGQKITELMEARRPFYEKADIIIDTEGRSPVEIADKIIEEARAYEKGNR